MTKIPSPVDANSKSSWLRQAGGAEAGGRGRSMFMPEVTSNAHASTHRNDFQVVKSQRGHSGGPNGRLF